jgi:Gpi18-like mannosyltransferase
MRRWSHPAFILATLVCGLAIRCALIGHVSEDASEYLIPWYQFARAHGLASLRYPFTNYPPYYSYLLLLVAQLDRIAPPLALIKAVSMVFELGCAAMVASIVRRAGGGRRAADLAFAGAWLAPTVLLNGPYWAQADSLWTFFILLSIRLFMAGGNGVPAFAVGFAVKAQSVFLGPFVLGMLLKRRIHWLWLAVVPAVYLLLALPVLIEGRSLMSVATVYLDQANTYTALSRNAANPWIFAPIGESFGVGIGMAAAAAAGLYLAWRASRVSMDDREGLLIAAALALLLMPFLLPKMHDRYFYAFELAAIAMACRNPRYVAVAVMAQADGVLSYMMFERHFPLLILTPAALCNGALVLLLAGEIGRSERAGRIPIVHLVAFMAAAGALVTNLLLTHPQKGAVGWYPLYAGAYCLAGVLLVLQTRRNATQEPLPTAVPGT